MPDLRALKVITITRTATSAASVVLPTIPGLDMEISYLFFELVDWRRLRYSNTTGTQDPILHLGVSILARSPGGQVKLFLKSGISSYFGKGIMLNGAVKKGNSVKLI